MSTILRRLLGPLLGGLLVLGAGMLGSAAVAATPEVGHPQAVTAAPVPTSSSIPAAAAKKGCWGPDILCDIGGVVVDGVLGATPIGAVAGVGDLFGGLGDAVGKTLLDGWTRVMLWIWAAGLFVLRVVLGFADFFMTPDLRANGPAKALYQYTFGLGGALVLVMGFVQLGVAAFKRDGKSLARVLVGVAQFVGVWFSWITYCVAVVAAAGGLSSALMKALLNVNTWNEWDPMGGLHLEDGVNGVIATILAGCGLIIWLAAIGHLLIMLARAAALIVLVGFGPISAAGLVADAGHSWFWKSLRWFHAAALTPVIMVLVLGCGIQLATGAAAGLADNSAKAIGTALPAVVLICTACVAPMALFKLLAFVDPGTPSGASFRQGMAANGGIQGLLSGKGSSDSGSSAAQSDSNGRSAGESGAETAATGRFGAAAGGTLGAVGGAVAAGVGAMQSIGAKGASLLADVSNQAGVGHHTYGPDFSSMRNERGGANGQHPGMGGDAGESGDDTTPPPPPPPVPPASPTLPTPAAQGGSGGTPGGGSKPSGGSGSGGAGGGATPPPTPPPVAV